MLSIKLARQSIRQNQRLYRPFVWATSATIALNFILALLADSKGVAALHRASIVISFLRYGQVILATLSLVFLLYTYRFVQKRKASELGLYQILGLRKTNLVAISFWQQIMMLAITLALGLVSGFVFSKALILLLVKLAGGSDFQLGLSLPGILIILLAVVAAFGLLFASDVFTILRSRALNLLFATKRGERNPKTHWLILLIGLVGLGTGYGLSLTIQTPTRHLSQILLAVMLVILATYCLFIAATTVILKVMANGRRYYQQPNRFIAVSNLLFRLRQNAVGLASIALLVTMTLVTLVTTAALYLGQQEYLRDYFPRDTVTQVSGDVDQARSQLDDLAAQNQVKVSNRYSVATSFLLSAELKHGNQLVVPTAPSPHTGPTSSS
ncbi:hypothetical protein PUF88_04235 [Lactobacillaceae bacterium L1_55_11]|nr:hypothetical protein [Lactobacillaceae bacterium L1_55_11]